MTTFVTVGNNKKPFKRLLDSVKLVSSELPQPLIIQHGYTEIDDSGCIAYSFLGMEEFVQQIRVADLVIMHAGAGSVIHAIHQGKVPVVMPRRAELGEHINNHQLELARTLSSLGKVVVAENDSEIVDAAKRAIALQRRGALSHGVPPDGGEARMISLVRQALFECAARTRYLLR